MMAIDFNPLQKFFGRMQMKKDQPGLCISLVLNGDGTENYSARGGGGLMKYYKIWHRYFGHVD
jgi:hypothetical protein